jgi:hypothetical protein
MFSPRTLAASLACTACLSVAAPALAIGSPEASPTGKGIVGGALLGAEALLLTGAAIDIEPHWLYLIGGAAGAIGGGIGGYYVEETGSAELSMLMLAAGMALAIPTSVAVLNATAYEAPTSYTQDRGPTDEPLADPPAPDAGFGDDPGGAGAQPGGTEGRRPGAKPRDEQRLGSSQSALVDVSTEGYLGVSLPPLVVKNAFSRLELERHIVSQRRELHVGLLRLSF